MPQHVPPLDEVSSGPENQSPTRHIGVRYQNSPLTPPCFFAGLAPREGWPSHSLWYLRVIEFLAGRSGIAWSNYAPLEFTYRYSSLLNVSSAAIRIASFQ